MKIYRRLLLLIATFILSANFLKAQEFTIRAADFYTININNFVIKLSFKSSSLHIYADGSDKEIDKFPFSEVFIGKLDSGVDYMVLRSVGWEIIEIMEKTILIEEYNINEDKYESTYEFYASEGTGLKDMIAVFKNENTFMFTTGSAKLGNIELEKAQDNAIIVSFNLDRIYNGNLMYDIQNVKVGTLDQTGERVVYGDISVKGSNNAEKEEYYITANKVLFGSFYYTELKGLDFDKLYKKALEKSGGAITAPSGSTAANSTFNWRARISEIMRTGSHAFKENGRVTDRMKGGVFATNSDQGLMIYQWADGAIYMGEIKNGKSSGNGVFIPAEEKYYQDIAGWEFFGGVYENGEPRHGISYDRNGNYFERAIFLNGEVAERTRDDSPTLKFQIIKYENNDPKNRDFYIGKTTNGLRRGIGMMVWKNNDIWIGHWSADLQFGNGIYISSDGTYTVGKWENGEFISEL